jgi:hypothetical protein
MRCHLLIILLFLSGCEFHFAKKIPESQIKSTDPGLRLRNGVFYYKDKLFSGHITEYYKGNKIHRDAEYLNGIHEGLELTYFYSGVLAEKRYYEAGEKAGVHTGFWENGKMRFQYSFNKGQYDGDFKQWYKNGRLYTIIQYNEGIEKNGKAWRESGKLYLNYVMRNGRRYGMINPNLCYTLKNEKGEFLKSMDVAKL